MKAIAEIRRDKLEMLIKEFGTQEKVAELGKTSAIYLSQIRNQTPDAKTGKPRQMGDPTARKLEIGCEKEHGWMDNLPTYAELNGTQDPRAKAMSVFESLPPDQWDIALRLLDALAQPGQ